MARFDLNDYVDVQTRITQFWQDYPDGRIVTTMLSDPNVFERVVVRAEVYKQRDHPHPDAADIAAEEKGQGGMANTTSWHENASTSAVGRALANMGYATSLKDRPSRQEMQKAARGQAKPVPTHAPANAPTPRTGPASPPQPVLRAGPGPASDKQLSMLRALAGKTNPDRSVMSDDHWLHGQVYARFRIAYLHELSKVHASALIDWFSKGGFLEPMWPAQPERVDAAEAVQGGLAQMPEEPSWLAAAPGEDRYSQ